MVLFRYGNRKHISWQSGSEKQLKMGNTTGKSKLDYIWNTAAGLINAAEAVIMSMIVTRVTGLTDAGMLTMAFAVGNLMMPIGKFGMRNFQVTDVEDKFSFSVYLKTRAVTVFMMAVSTVIYLAYAYNRLGYSYEKIGIIFAICMIYAVEAAEDVVWGYYQHRGRLYAGAKMFCCRWSGILVVFAMMLCVTRNLMLTLLLCWLFSLALFILLLRGSYRHICAEEDRTIKPMVSKAEWRQIGKLLRIVFPLFGISFLAFYENNAPKYAIDACLTDTVQACYGFIAMPVFVIGLLNNFIYQPMLVPMAVEWEQGRIDKFKKRIVKQFAVIAGISVICILGAYLLGIPVLSLLYNTDLSAYKGELIVLLFASAFLAASGYQGVVLTIMRFQKLLLWPHCIVSAVAAIALKYAVGKYQTMGAACGYLLLMMLLCMLYGGILIVKLRTVGEGSHA